MPPPFTSFTLCSSGRRHLLWTRPGFFHTGIAWKNDNVDHYETLGLDSTASPVAIKKQFYSLSKTHHPDHNPNDPEAGNRFVRISEAYAVLGNSEKRERYDRDTRRFSARSPSDAQHRSHSGSGPFGSRPASGLSRRRTHFRGPPPSFYRGGGWGSQAAKRTAQADPTSTASSSAGFRCDEVDDRNTGSFGFSGTYVGWKNDVPHFDHEGHYRTHRWQEQKRIRRSRESPFDSGGGGAIWINFLVVSGVISLAFLISTTLQSSKFSNKKNPQTSPRPTCTDI